MKIDTVVVVGGGSAGWMTAATFAKFFPKKKITVIESPDIPTVGVGESTLGQIRKWTHVLGIDEREFMRCTNASYKLSIKFTDFYEKDGGSFHYPFGDPYFDKDDWDDWQVKKVVYPETPVQDYCRTFWPAMPLIENNRFSLNHTGEFLNFRSNNDVAYHFDAALFGKWLRENYCIPRGVVHVAAEVRSVVTGEEGVEKLVLKSGEEVTADLYIDCTGWKSMLIGEAMREPFVSWEDTLPNNRAWAVQVPYTDKKVELEGYTNCTAIDNGWVWNIPLWTRIGTGYVYSDKFVTPEDALLQLKKHLNSSKMTIHDPNRVTDDLVFKDIKIRTGIHKRTWVKNVVAIGLSAGFIEPLESNGLLSVHEFLFMLMKNIDRPRVTQWDRDVYNARVLSYFNNFAEFVALHYALSIRDDTEYWRAVSNKTFCQDMIDQVCTKRSGFNDLADKKMFHLKHFGPGGINCIATGMNYGMLDIGDVMHRESLHRINMKAEIDEWVKRREFLQ